MASWFFFNLIEYQRQKWILRPFKFRPIEVFLEPRVLSHSLSHFFKLKLPLANTKTQRSTTTNWILSGINPIVGCDTNRFPFIFAILTVYVIRRSFGNQSLVVFLAIFNSISPNLGFSILGDFQWDFKKRPKIKFFAKVFLWNFFMFLYCIRFQPWEVSFFLLLKLEV